MNIPFVKGISFGLTSGIITTLGMIVGMYSLSPTKYYIIGAILAIAIADSFSDALGMHMSEESAKKKTRDVWTSTFSTFLGKVVFTSLFIIPFLITDVNSAIVMSLAWGFLLLITLSYFIAIEDKEKPWKVILSHIVISAFVVLASSYVGSIINAFFK